MNNFHAVPPPFTTPPRTGVGAFCFGTLCSLILFVAVANVEGAEPAKASAVKGDLEKAKALYLELSSLRHSPGFHKNGFADLDARSWLERWKAFREEAQKEQISKGIFVFDLFVLGGEWWRHGGKDTDDSLLITNKWNRALGLAPKDQTPEETGAPVGQSKEELSSTRPPDAKPSDTIYSPRTWTNAEGTEKFDGTFQRISGDKAVFLKDGSPLSIPIKRLSEVDRKWMGQGISFTTLDGVRFQDVAISAFDADAVVVTSSSSVRKVDLERLPEELKLRFSHEPVAEPAVGQSDKKHPFTIISDKTLVIPNESGERTMHRNVEVRLQERVSEQQLRDIALQIRAADPRTFQGTTIVYHLPGGQIGAGCWAITRFEPELSVKILGTRENPGDAKADPTIPAGQIVGRWEDADSSGIVYTLVRGTEGWVLHRRFSRTTTDTFVVTLTKKGSGTVVMPQRPNEYGEYWIIDVEGNLLLMDSDGFIAKAPKLK